MSTYDIEGVKRRNPIEEIISRHGIVLLRHGSRMTGLCPFHDDANPSLVVYPDTRSFYCFGCGASGDVIDFVRRYDGLGFRAALERLNEGVVPQPDARQVRHHRSGGQSVSHRREELSLDDRMILTAASSVYHELLWQSPAALAYLEGRGIGPAVIRRCRLGFSDGHTLRRYLQRHRMSIRRAQELGLIWRGGNERMAGRIVVPEIRGDQCVWMVGRPIEEDRDPKYRGLSLPKPILGYDRVRGRKHIYLTEGTFDYLTGVGWSLPICALQGIRLRPERLSFLERARRVFLIFDNDSSGDKANAYLSELLGSRAVIVRLPEGIKDLNLLGQRPDGRDRFFRLLREAEAREEADHAPPAS